MRISVDEGQGERKGKEVREGRKGKGERCGGRQGRRAGEGERRQRARAEPCLYITAAGSHGDKCQASYDVRR